MRKAFLAVATLLLAVTAAVAQVPTGSIAGTVTDPAGLAVVGAEVVIINQGTGAEYRATTGDLGGFRVTTLQAGLYRVRVVADGFKLYEVSDIKLDAGTEYSVPPIQLELGTQTETVIVEAGAQLVQTTSATLSGTIEKRQFDALPILNRNPMSLINLQAGSTFSGRANSTVHGMRTSFGNITLDGINIQDNFIRSNSSDFVPVRPTISQVSEFTMTQGNAGTEAGLGSSQVSFVTPSGTNEYHGDLFWYHRNNVLAASEWFATALGNDPTTGQPVVPKEKLIQNQLGGTIGGPVVADKLFFFGNYEAFRLRQQTTQNTVVLTDPARQGIFTYRATCTTSCPEGITNGQVLTQNVLDASGLPIDPFMAQLLTRVPTSINNFDTGDSTSSLLRNTAGFRMVQGNNQDRDQYGFKIDYTPTAEHSISGTYSWIRVFNQRPDIDNSFNADPITFTNSSIPFLSTAWRWSPSGNFTNEVRFGFVLSDVVFETDRQFGDFTVTGTLFTNPDVNFRRQGRNTNTYSLQDNASYTTGNHTFRFGYLNQFIRVRAFSSFTIPRNFALGISSASDDGLAQSDFPGGITSADLSRANSLLATLAGIVSSGSEEFNVASRTSGFVPGAESVNNLLLNNYSFYFGDSWRLRQNFTATYGVRWEYIGRFDEANGLFLAPVIDENAPVNPFRPFLAPAVRTLLDPNATLDFVGGDTGRNIYEKDLNNFAPNVGFAWDPFGNGKTSVRAAYSIHFVNDEAIRAADNAVSANPGLNTTLGTGALGGVYLSGNLPTITPPTLIVPRSLTVSRQQNNNLPVTIFTVDPNYRTPYVQQWNLSVSREVGWNTVVDVRYVGNKGTSLSRGIDFNQVLITPNGFLEDFLRARRNGFTNLANTGVFDPRCNFEGCEPLTVLTQASFGGLLTNSTIRNRIQTGQVGDLAAIYHFNNLSGTLDLVPNATAGVADLLTNLSHSSYHGGVAEVRRRMSRGLYFQANYTWSKVLTDSSGTGQTNFDPFLDLDQPGRERARALFDIEHAFKANFVYDLPFGTGQRWSAANSFLSKVISGWTVTSIFTWQSGAPWSIIAPRGTLNRAGRSGQNTPFSLLSQREIKKLVKIRKEPGLVSILPSSIIAPDGRGTGDDAIGCTPSFSGQIFCNPEPGMLGNLGINVFNNEPFFNWDFSVLKTTSVTETVRVEFRAEFFNLPNHPTFINGDESIFSTSFGRVTGTLSNPRITQLALRVVF